MRCHVSIKNSLGLNAPEEKVADKRAKGIGMLMANIRNTYTGLLSEAALFRWHSMLLGYNPEITSGNYKNLFNDRQPNVVKKMFDAGPAGFEGGMNASKYSSLTQASKATATRDLQDLLQKDAIIHLGESGRRSTRYQLNLPGINK